MLGLGGGGASVIDQSTTIHLSMTVPTSVDRGAVGREVVEAILEYQREAGPVFVTTRR